MKMKTFDNNVYFQDTVDDETTLDLIIEMERLKKEYTQVKLWLHSEGGEGCCGLRTMDTLIEMQNESFEITTIAFGEVMSSAVYLLLAGKKRYMTKNSFVLIHQASLENLPQMYHSDLKNYVNFLDRSKIIDFNIFCSEYARVPKKVMKKLLSSDNNYLEPDKCIKWGIVHGVYHGSINDRKCSVM